VKVRGFRVELSEVEKALCSCPGVNEAAVVAREDGVDGQLLIACIVGDGAQTPGVDTIRRYLRERVPGPMIPSRIWSVEALPRTPSGKVDRQSLVEARPHEESTAQRHVSPRDELEAQLAVIWEDLLQIRPIGVTDDFFDLGGHSLLAVRLAARIEQKWGRSLALSDLLMGSTIEELASRLRESVKSSAASSLISLGTSGPGHPLFLVHPIGGGVLCYNALARRLDGAHAVLGLQAAGLDGEVEPVADLVRMASRYVETLLAEHPEGPYFLGGWSMGGVVALEMARQLAATGREVPFIFLIDCSAPVPHHAPHAMSDRDSLMAFVADLARTAGRPTWTSPEHFRSLDPESIRDGTLEQSSLGREIADEIGSERFRRLHDVYRANRLALDGYQPRTYSGRIILIRAESSRSDFEGDPTRGWDDLAVGGITTYHVPGDHYTILQRPAVERLAEILAGEIEGLESTTGKIHPR